MHICLTIHMSLPSWLFPYILLSIHITWDFPAKPVIRRNLPRYQPTTSNTPCMTTIRASSQGKLYIIEEAGNIITASLPTPPLQTSFLVTHSRRTKVAQLPAEPISLTAIYVHSFVNGCLLHDFTVLPLLSQPGLLLFKSFYSLPPSLLFCCLRRRWSYCWIRAVTYRSGGLSLLSYPIN